MPRHATTTPRRPGRVGPVLVGVLVLALTALGGAAALTGWPGDGAAADTVADPASPTSAPPTPTPTPTPTPPPDTVLTLVAAGDVLPHLSVVSDARTAAGLDFTPMLAGVQDWVAGADLALCHMEVPVAPDGVASGYPLFGAPKEVVAGLAATGWDGCSTASNHSLDRGAAGVASTLAALEEAGLGHAGTARSAEEAATTQLYTLERDGREVTVAHIAATYGTNGLPVPTDAPWSVQLIDTAALVAQATAARSAGADLVVASVHCCVEYVSEPTDQQLQIAAELAASGQVDLLIGHHAHVPQPIDMLPGGPGGAGMWVAYGLGNFVSNQDDECCVAATDSGLLLSATLVAPADGPARVTQVSWSAVTVDRADGHRVLPLSALVASGAGSGSVSAENLATRLARVVAVVGTRAPQVPEPGTASGPPPTLSRTAG